MLSSKTYRRSRENGQVVVFFALLIPVLFAVGAIVIDVGNWYAHKRHLQTQVDAAAFAGATKFTGCNPLFDPAAANKAIKGAALEYAGDSLRAPSTIDPSFTSTVRNPQLAEPGDVRIVLNSATYWDPVNGKNPVGGYGLDDTEDRDGDPATPGDHCTAEAVDAKGTDEDVRNLWGLIPLSPSVKAHARVEIHQILEESGMLPFAVPEIDPAAVFAIFVNENTGAVIGTQQLCNLAVCTANGVAPIPPFSYWRSSIGQQTLDIPSENTSVVILISKNDTSQSMSGTLAQICGQSPGLVRCHAGSSATSGVNFIHGWSDAPGSPKNPQIRDVSLFGCTDPSAPYFLNSADCAVGATVKIDFGFPGDPTPGTKKTPAGIAATAALYASANCSGNKDPLGWISTSGTLSTWNGGAKLIVAGSGRNPLSVGWSSDTEEPDPPPPGKTKTVSHSGCFPLVAAPYAANDASGPLEYVAISGTDLPPYPPVIDPNSRNTGPNHNVIVTVGLNKPLKITNPLDPPFLLRFASKSGSLNQALDCDAGIVFAVEIADGCRTKYRLNYYDWDKNKATPYTWEDIRCTAYPSPSDLPPPTFEPPLGTKAPNCVAAKTGDVVAMRQGLYKRFQDPSCTPNNWPTTPAEVTPFFLKYDFANDPRYVTLVITDFTAFTGNGAENVPVKYFAGFYATGWDRGPAGGGNQTGCPDNDLHPLGLSDLKDNGDVWGHFVQIVIPSSTGEASEELCNFDELGNCIAVLVE
jgi:hypothetical protein